jgi:hypothetical protein
VVADDAKVPPDPFYGAGNWSKAAGDVGKGEGFEAPCAVESEEGVTRSPT